jgi:hypothetical protein
VTFTLPTKAPCAAVLTTGEPDETPVITERAVELPQRALVLFRLAPLSNAPD